MFEPLKKQKPDVNLHNRFIYFFYKNIILPVQQGF